MSFFGTPRRPLTLAERYEAKVMAEARRIQSTATPGINNTSKTTSSIPDKMDAMGQTLHEAIDSAKLSHFSAESTVTLLVGEDEQKMIAYGSHLARDSEFFAAAWKKEWAEGQTRTIKLPEESTGTMSHYLSYVYSGKLFTESVTALPTPDQDDHIGKCFELLASLYICGERFMNRRIQQAAVREILRFTRILDEDSDTWIPDWVCVNLMYQGTPEGSPGRRLMVDLHIKLGDEGILKQQHDIDTEFVADLAKSLFAMTKHHPWRMNSAYKLQAENYY